jgi:hypothetical protein
MKSGIKKRSAKDETKEQGQPNRVSISPAMTDVFFNAGRGLWILWWFSAHFPAEERRSNSAWTEPPPLNGGNLDNGKRYEPKNGA